MLPSKGTGAQNLNSPTEMGLVGNSSTPQSPDDIRPYDGGGQEKVQMKKQLGLLEGCAIILGIIIGSGVFVSPKGVIQEVNAVGTSLLIWVVCGLLSMIGALCYAELGTLIPKSGGDYAYILEAFGPLPAFLYLWDATFIFVPTTNAIMSMTFASYVLQPFFNSDCQPPGLSIQLLAAVTICLLTFINCYDIKSTTKLQNVIMFAKIGALVIIVIVGLVWMCMGNVENFENPFDDTETDPGKLSVAFYSGIFSYAGWNYLNFMTEELRDPYKNLPRAIFISLPLVTVIYVLANMAYLAVLTPEELIASNAIAVTFGNKIMGYMAWIIPLMVAISSFGGLSVHIMTSSRMCFVGARNGHMPAILSHINVNKFSPTPSLVFLCILSLIMLSISDVYVLITYCSIVESSFIMLSVGAVLYFRYKYPKKERPIKVSLWIPIVFCLICAFLIVVPCYVAPYEVVMGILITITGIPFYYVGVVWENKPQWLMKTIVAGTHICQKLFMSSIEEKED
ncbi:Y+L amino acid transporter 2 [Phlebotomus papatasi]|nr:Y+L amino acid transporter 2 [Phlebotomus papatasi]XP_055699329.1 Y+L amino acid transporter 2 [Phlebotomus papatasi]